MKRLLSLFIIICICITAIPASAETVIELDPLRYEEYMYEETVVVTGYSNAYVSLGLYYPESYGSTAKYVMTYSPAELNEGIEIALGEQSRLWPEGVWTIIVQSGDVSDTLEFTLCETVDRTEDDDFSDDAAKPDDTTGKKPSGNTTVTAIIPDKTELTLTEGATESMNITSSAKSFTLEVEDEKVISASVSNKVLTVTALKKGTSQIWIKTGSNYASVNVTVKKGEVVPTEPVTEPVTEAPTEEATEPFEEATEEPAQEIANPFDDIENHWAKDSILSLYQKGIINGMDEKTFAPDAFVTRAQFVTMLYKAFNLKHMTSSSPFKDVDNDDWFHEAVMAAYDNLITTGDTSGNFNPTSLVTRQDMAVFAHRTMNSVGKAITFVPGMKPFEDHSKIKDYAVEAVYAMKNAGIINGMTETTFEPLGNATRAQAAHIIAKLLEL